MACEGRPKGSTALQPSMRVTGEGAGQTGQDAFIPALPPSDAEVTPNQTCFHLKSCGFVQEERRFSAGRAGRGLAVRFKGLMFKITLMRLGTKSSLIVIVSAHGLTNTFHN